MNRPATTEDPRPVDVYADRLGRSGWSCGENAITAEGATQVGAWRKAALDAWTLGMLRGGVP